jgi:hypothetical protein
MSIITGLLDVDAIAPQPSPFNIGLQSASPIT